MGGVVGSVAGVPIDERVVVKIPESVPAAVMSLVFFQLHEATGSGLLLSSIKLVRLFVSDTGSTN